MYFNLNNDSPPLALSELIIREVQPDNDLSDWVKPVRESFPSSDQVEGYRKLNAAISHGPGTAFRHYVGYYHDQPVSAVTLFIHDQAVMIHNLATRPDYCRRGFGSALTLHAMQAAKQLGIKHCFLDSSIKGMNVYLRLGFKMYANYQVYGTK